MGDNKLILSGYETKAVLLQNKNAHIQIRVLVDTAWA
jgi:hypothetical protein